jgi:WD40 repeat protein
MKSEKRNVHSMLITSVAFNPVDGKTIVSGSFDKTIKVWDSGACVFSNLSIPFTDSLAYLWQARWTSRLRRVV